MNIIEKQLAEIKPYGNNPRNNDSAVEAVAKSIETFGFKVPIVIDSNGVIVAGHTRYKAAKKLEIKAVPCVVADDLTEEQIKAFRLADNKVSELATWDFDSLADELADITDIDMSDFGFDVDMRLGEPTEVVEDDYDEIISEKEREFKQRMANGEISEEDEEYQEFLEKFKLKKTTDDCYTPELVYNAICEWVEKEYNVKRKDFVRPFYPGGDYQKENYPNGCIVVDNPPFSILSEIVKFYFDNSVKYFLFAPTLTLFSSSASYSSAIPLGVAVTYENCANVNTSFLTNLEDENIRVRSAPTLYVAVDKANKQNLRSQHKELPKYEYPDYVITSTRVAQFSRYGLDFKVFKDESVHIRQLECQKKSKKAIFGSGYLVSELTKVEKEKVEKEKVEKEKVEKWQLSQKEMALIKSLKRR